jgi:hypothetical protein
VAIEDHDPPIQPRTVQVEGVVRLLFQSPYSHALVLYFDGPEERDYSIQSTTVVIVDGERWPCPFSTAELLAWRRRARGAVRAGLTARRDGWVESVAFTTAAGGRP